MDNIIIHAAPQTPSGYKKNFWSVSSQYGYEHVVRKYGHYTIWKNKVNI